MRVKFIAILILLVLTNFNTTTDADFQQITEIETKDTVSPATVEDPIKFGAQLKSIKETAEVRVASASADLKEKEQQLEEHEYIGEFVITAYTAGYESTGKYPDDPLYGITASGKIVKENHTIAADWTVFPVGTKVYIEDVSVRVVEDRGSAIKGKKLDLYIPKLENALEWGVRSRDVYVIKWGDDNNF